MMRKVSSLLKTLDRNVKSLKMEDQQSRFQITAVSFSNKPDIRMRSCWCFKEITDAWATSTLVPVLLIIAE